MCLHASHVLTLDSFAFLFSGASSTSLTATATPTSLSDHTGGGNYANNVDCTWYISASTSYIRLVFQSFATESGYVRSWQSSTHSSRTPQDHLRIYSWPANVLQHSLSGTYASGHTLNFTTNIKMTFTTDSSVDNTGWTLTYAAGSCEYLLNISFRLYCSPFHDWSV